MLVFKYNIVFEIVGTDLPTILTVNIKIKNLILTH